MPTTYPVLKVAKYCGLLRYSLNESFKIHFLSVMEQAKQQLLLSVFSSPAFYILFSFLIPHSSSVRSFLEVLAEPIKSMKNYLKQRLCVKNLVLHFPYVCLM